MNEQAQSIIDQFKEDIDKYQGGEVVAKGAITGILEKACGGKNERYTVLKVLTGKTSSKDLHEAEWYGLLCLVQPYKPEGGHWCSQRSDELKNMCGILIRSQWIEEGQMEMFNAENKK